MEHYKSGKGSVKILLTFFSPSGYEVCKNYPNADFIFYLPADTRANAKRWVESLPLKAAFFIKYEFWFNYLFELKKKNVSTYLVSGTFRKTQYFFTFYGKWALGHLNYFKLLFLQEEHSKLLLKQYGILNTEVCGDTRFDRVFEIARNKKKFPLLEQFAQDSQVLIAGSTWKEDEQIMKDSLQLASGQPGVKRKDLKLIIAPHEVDEHHIHWLMSLFSPEQVLRYSKANEQNIKNVRVLIVDSIGILSSLYQYGQVAYIGGGFGNGIHNILEPAVFGLPVIFGPNYSKYNEAVELVELEGAFVIKNERQLDQVICSLFGDLDYLKKVTAVCQRYSLKNRGATQAIIHQVNLFSTNTVPATFTL